MDIGCSVFLYGLNQVFFSVGCFITLLVLVSAFKHGLMVVFIRGALYFLHVWSYYSVVS